MALPHLIGPYRPLARIGAGGMGTVYYCLHPGTGQPLAVKVLHAEHAHDLAHRQRFAREVAVLRKVQGPYLVPLVDADPGAEQPWLATPYVPGNTLHQHVQQHGPLTGESLTTFAAATAHALACIHWAGVAHRDLKPTNVILAADGPRVLDFGIAHHLDATVVTATRMTTGTPGWMAPEQLSRGETTTATDVFVWGLLVCFAATGRHPFGNPTGIDFRIVGNAPDLGGVPAGLAGHVTAALDKEPANRPTAAALAEVVAAVYGPSGTRVFPAAAFTQVVADAVPERPVPAHWTVPAADTDLTKVLGSAVADAPTQVRAVAPPAAPPVAPPVSATASAPQRPGRGRALAAVLASGVTLALLAAGVVLAATSNGGSTHQQAGAAAVPAPSTSTPSPADTTPAPASPSTRPADTPTPSPSPIPTPTSTVESLFGGMGITVQTDWLATKDPRNDGPAVPANGAGVALGRYQPVGGGFNGLLIAFDPGETVDRMFPTDLTASSILWAQQDGSSPETITAAQAGPLVAVGERKAESWTVRTDLLPDYNGTRTHTHRVWWLPASHIRITTYGELTAAQDSEVDRMIASITTGPADLPLDCADGVAYLDRIHAQAGNTSVVGFNCAALAFGGSATAQDSGTIRTGTEAACVALVEGYLSGSAGLPTDTHWAADRAGCDLPVRS